MNEFQENILDHYKNPRNFGKPLWSFNSVQEAKNISCGDEIKIYVEKNDSHINHIAFEGEGCSISIASASIISEVFINKPVSEILDLSDDEFIKKYIGIELTLSRRKCALLAFSALKQSLL